jgi:hypothetical protein
MTAMKTMRGSQDFQGTMFSYISLEERVPAAHPLRKLRGVVDALLATMDRESWASHKSFKRRDDDSSPPPGRNPEVNFKGQERSNDTHESTTDADARLFKKSPGDKSRLCHMGHILMENRNRLIVDVEITHASGTAEREAALAMLGRRPNRHRRVTVGADKGYDCKAFITGCRRLKVTPHVAAKDKHSAVDGRIRRHEGYKISLKVRKRIEEAFG